VIVPQCFMPDLSSKLTHENQSGQTERSKLNRH